MAFLTRIRGMCRPAAWRLALALLAGLATPVRAAEQPTTDEYKIKAAFLFYFAQFVEWPARAFPAPEAPLVIGVLGQDPFGRFLDDLVRGEKVGRRSLVVRRFEHAEEIKECHILFISGSESEHLEKIFTQLKGRSILTVGDLEAFARRGGMVRFVTENGKIRLRIFLEAARAGELTISSKILSPSTIVGPGNW